MLTDCHVGNEARVQGRHVQLGVTDTSETNEVFQTANFLSEGLSDVFIRRASKDSGRLDGSQFEHESAVSQYCRPTPKANWKVGLKGASDSGLQVSTSIHCRETCQRPKEIPRWGGEANRHLSALGNSSIDRDANSSISYARTHTDSTRTAVLMRYKTKGYCTWTGVSVQSWVVAKFPTAHKQLQFPPFSISMIKRPRNSTANGGFLKEIKGTWGGEMAGKRDGPTSWDNQFGSSGNFHLPLKILICVSATLPIDASN